MPSSIEKAAKDGDVETIRLALQREGSFSLEVAFDRALTDFRTIKRNSGHFQILKLVFDAGLTPGSRIGWMNQSLLCACAMYGNRAIIDYILSRWRSNDAFSSAALGDAASIRVAGDAAALSIDVNGFNALHYCASSNLGAYDAPRARSLVETARTLLENGADPCREVKMNGLTITPLLLCAWFGGNADLVEPLVRADVEIEAHGFVALDFALEPHQRSGEPHYAVAERLLRLGVNIDHCNTAQRRTLLHGAAWRGSIKATRWLLDNGANVQAADVDGRTPLHLAAERNTYNTVVRLLLDRGAEVNLKDNRGQTPLALAMAKGRVRIADYLKERGAQ